MAGIYVSGCAGAGPLNLATISDTQEEKKEVRVTLGMDPHIPVIPLPNLSSSSFHSFTHSSNGDNEEGI